jgi:hypothetical protein
MKSTIIILSILLAIFTWNVAEFGEAPKAFQVFAGAVFVFNTLFLLIFIAIEVND